MITRRLYPLLKAIYPKGVVTSEQLAKVMLTIGLHGGKQKIYENPEIRKVSIRSYLYLSGRTKFV